MSAPMKPKSRRVLFPLALLAVPAALLSGCGDGGGGGSGQTNFDSFVIDLVQNRTSDTAEPAPIEGKTFRFDDDPAAFDELFR